MRELLNIARIIVHNYTDVESNSMRKIEMESSTVKPKLNPLIKNIIDIIFCDHILSPVLYREFLSRVHRALQCHCRVLSTCHFGAPTIATTFCIFP